MSRITSKDFFKRAELLEQAMGVPLSTNVWHKHFSVYTKGPNNSNQYLLVSSDTALGACLQIESIKNALYVLNILKSEVRS